VIDRSSTPDDRVDVIVMVDEVTDVDTADLERSLHPARVSIVGVSGDAEDAAAAIKSRPRVDVVVDATTGRDRVALARQVVWAVKDHGTYLAVGAGRRWARGVEAVRRPTSGESTIARRRRQELDESIGAVETIGRARVVEKTHDHHGVLRHSEVEQVLAERYGPPWGEVLVRRDAHEFASRASVVMHGEPSTGHKPDVIAVPELAVRRYADVTCHMREILTRDNLVLPDTYRHWQSKNLFHKRIHPVSPSFGRLVDEVARADVTTQRGVFYSFDSAFPSHFGHLMTETISRFWGWQHAVKEHPDVRPVITHQAGKPALPAWKAEVLRALGIPVDDILWVREGEAVRVDALVAAMPQLVNPHYVDPAIAGTWAAIAAGVGDDPAPTSGPEKIFLSRRRQSQRTCSNAPQVEAFFEEQGYAIVLPEKLSFAEQVHLFRRAKVIAGFGGSALFNAMFNSEARILVLTSRSYVAANEYLIASANGNEIHYFWAPPAIEQPSSGFSTEAYRSGFEFPLDEHRDALVAASR
jgi:capsular polysaccharide biosynthesis protein